MSKEQIATMLDRLCYLQGAMGDKLLWLSCGCSGYAYGVAIELNVVLNSIDVLTDAYLRANASLPGIATDAELEQLYGEAIAILT